MSAPEPKPNVNILTDREHVLMDLFTATSQAGGSVRCNIERISALELISLIAPNHITFVYRPRDTPKP